MNITSVDAEALFGTSVRMLAAVVKLLHSSSAQIPKRRRSTEHECSKSKAK